MSFDAETTAIFLAEAAELQARIERGLLDLEGDPGNRDLIDTLFRDLHTLKGTAAMFGYQALSQFAHEFESVFDDLRQPGRTAGGALIAVALRACDHFGRLLNDPDAGSAESATILADLHASQHQTPSAGDAGWTIRLTLLPSALQHGLNIFAILDDLRALDPAATLRIDTGNLASPDRLDPLRPALGWTVGLPGTVTRAAIEEALMFAAGALEMQIDPPGTQPPRDAADTSAPDPEGRPGAPRDAAAAGAETMRVSTQRLDELMDRVGELVIAESRLRELLRTSAEPRFLSVAEDIARLTAGMRDTTMSMRMVPVGSLFGRFRRLVHDLSAQLGKPVDFVTLGGETELDKTVIEALADPLVHMLRNALDHGMERAEERVARSKPETGRITLTASHAGAEVHLRIEDDGRGLDLERIRARAIERGLIPADADLPPADLRALIFAPGFSTAAEVTELSGRGVGLDVVRTTITRLRGSIQVDSEPGHGTTVTLRLPLTLAIIDSLLIEIGTERYAIPVASIEECVELPATALGDRDGPDFLNVRGEVVPFLRLADLFDQPGPRSDFQKVVIVSVGGGRVGIVVDRIVSNSQTVIKQLSALHLGLRAFSGATILGDGSVALILDVAHLIATVRAQAPHATGKAA